MKPGALVAGRYRIDRELGAGGMSSVWVATDTRFDVAVALKVAYPKGLAIVEFEARFRREAMIGRLLGQQARGFVRVLDWGHLEGGDGLFLVMDLIEEASDLDLVGGTRQERLERLVAAGRLIRDAHALGIAHRDLKPANFLLREGRADQGVFLTDFGLAKVVGKDGEDDDDPVPAPLANMTRSGIVMGTPWYMPPEQFDAKRADTRADVYSFGVMLYEALTGDLPFKPKLAELIDLHARLRDRALRVRPSDRASDVPPELDALCGRCLEHDPADRPAMTEVVAALERAVGVQTPPSPPAAPRTRLEPLPGPHVALGQAPPRGRRRRAMDESSDELAFLAFADEAPQPDDGQPLDAVSASEGPTVAPGAVAPVIARGPEPPPGVRRTGAREYVNATDGSVLVWVPPGEHLPRLPEADAPQATPRTTRVEGFLAGKHPVTWGQYRRFCEATGRRPPAPRLPGVDDDHPVHGVTWADARAYCAWAGLRLLTEAEWEYAASGDAPRRLPWGDEPPAPDRCCYAGHPRFGSSTAPVGSFPRGASPFGVEDTAGNVLEWVDDRRPSAATRPLRGGSFRLEPSGLHARRRHLLPADAREGHVGFRVARDLAPSRSMGRRLPARALDPAALRRAGAALLDRLKRLLPDRASAAGLSTRDLELRFTWGAERGVPLSLRLDDPRPLAGEEGEPALVVAHLEQRMTLARDALRGSPGGVANLLRAANALNGAALGVRCALTEDRLRYRRELLLRAPGHVTGDEVGDEPVASDDLRAAIERVVDAWRRVVGPLRQVQEGAPWSTALRDALAGQLRPLAAVRDLAPLLDRGWHLMTVEAGLGVWPGSSDVDPEPDVDPPVVLARRGDDLCLTRLVRAWPGTGAEAAALRDGAAAPRVDALLEALNARNASAPWSLSWQPGRGVEARLLLGPTNDAALVQRAVRTLDRVARELELDVPGW